MSQAETWTVGRLLTWTTDFLKQRGVENPRLEAELLLGEVRGVPRIQLYASFSEVADEATRQAFRELVRRRAEGTPVAYLLGRREFYSLSFRVTPDVLIPRPETEFLVVALLDRAKERPTGRDALTIADVGAGSGVLAVCGARYLPEASVTALDTSAAALEVARGNAETHGVAERITFLESDLFAAVPADARFDFIVSNPPYISEAEFDQLAPDVRNYEPRAALVAGPRGTEVIERLLAQAAERLLPGGWLLLEVSPMIAEAVGRMIAEEGHFEMGPVMKDLAGHARVFQARRNVDASRAAGGAA